MRTLPAAGFPTGKMICIALHALSGGLNHNRGEIFGVPWEQGEDLCRNALTPNKQHAVAEWFPLPKQGTDDADIRLAEYYSCLKLVEDGTYDPDHTEAVFQEAIKKKMLVPSDGERVLALLKTARAKAEAKKAAPLSQGLVGDLAHLPHAVQTGHLTAAAATATVDGLMKAGVFDPVAANKLKADIAAAAERARAEAKK